MTFLDFPCFLLKNPHEPLLSSLLFLSPSLEAHKLRQPNSRPAPPSVLHHHPPQLPRFLYLSSTTNPFSLLAYTGSKKTCSPPSPQLHALCWFELWEALTSAFLFISTLGSFHLSEPSSSPIALKRAELKSIQDSTFFDICDLMAFISNFVLVLYGHLLNTGAPTDSTPATAVNCHLCVK